MRRINLLRLVIAFCVAVLSLAVLPSGSPRAQVSTPPNILLIVTDDQPPQSIRVMPETARLVRDAGINFRKATVATPLCCPSRASLMTGRYAHNHGVQLQNGRDLDQSTTVQRYLQDGGYKTAAIGKFLNGFWDEQGNPLAPDHFDRWAIMKTNHLPYRGFPVNDMGELRTEDTYSTTFIGQRSAEFITEFDTVDDGAPWFAWVGFQAPHLPVDPEDKYRYAPVPAWNPPPSVGEEDRTDKPRWVTKFHRTFADGVIRRTDMFRMLMSVDDQVEYLVATLEALGELDNTIIVFTTDNGYLIADHGVGAKRYPYRNSIEVPLFVRWSAELPSDSVNKDLVSNIDLAPMFLEAAGIEAPTDPPMDGRSPLSSPPRERVHIEYFKDIGAVPTWSATLKPNSYYIEAYDEAGERIFQEFYWLDEDPWMLRNVMLADGGADAPNPARLLQEQLEVQNDQRCSGLTCP